MYFYYINQTTSIIYTLSLHDALPIFVQRRKFTLKNRLHISLCIGRDLALCQIKTESGQRCYDEHHGGKQSGAKARYAFVSRWNSRAHGKSTWSVWPLFNSTGFSRVVLLSIHALRV